MKKIDSLKWLWIIGFPAFFSGFLVFYALFRLGEESAAQTSQLIQTQLIYILSEKDDMELIDFGHFLKNSNPALTLRASTNEKIVLSLGDLGGSPTQPPYFPGLHFEFPNQWIFRSTEPLPEPAGSQLDLILSFPIAPNPWSWAMIDLFSCLLIGMGLIRLFTYKLVVNLTESDPAASHSLSPALSPHPSSLPIAANSNPCQLRVDRNYLIKSASENAVTLLQKKLDEVVGHHILDLSPHPALLEVLKQSQDAKIENAFLTPLHITAEILNEKDGWLIVLEKA